MSKFDYGLTNRQPSEAEELTAAVARIADALEKIAESLRLLASSGGDRSGR